MDQPPILPALPAGALPPEPAREPAISTTVAAVHTAMSNLPLGVQQEIQDLFGLLAPTVTA